MKKRSSFTLCLALLFCLCSFSGCKKDEPLFATGEYNGQKITLTFDGPTDFPFPYDWYAMSQVNGYVVFVDDSNYVEGQLETRGFNAMDPNGVRVFDEIYHEMTHFDADGWCAVREIPGEAELYRMLHVSGESYPITKEEFSQHFGKVMTYPPYAAEPEIPGVDTSGVGKYTGHVYNGLAPYVVPTDEEDANYLLGLCDSDGNIIIPAFIPVSDYDIYTSTLSASEDRIFFCYSDRIAIATITRE